MSYHPELKRALSHEEDFHSTASHTNTRFDPESASSPRALPQPFALPSCFPDDFYLNNGSFYASEEVAYLVQPSHWQVTSVQGPTPFITEIRYQLPTSGMTAVWTSRAHRKEAEMLIDYSTAFDAKQAKVLSERRREFSLPWWKRIANWHLSSVSWWSVLMWNVGSHAFLYAGISLFIPSFNQNAYWYQSNTGWSSIFFALCFWGVGAILEIVALFTTNAHGKWIQFPRSLSSQLGHFHRSLKHASKTKQQSKAVDDNREELDHFIAPLTLSALSKRLDFWIALTRLLGVVVLFISAISYSGSFNYISRDAYYGLVCFPYILGGLILVISGYLSIVEVTNSWLPWKRDALHSLAYWSTAMFTVGAAANFIAYGIMLIFYNQPEDIYNQRQGPAIPFIIGAFLLTASDWCQLVEQGETLGKNAWTGVTPQQVHDRNNSKVMTQTQDSLAGQGHSISVTVPPSASE